MGSVPSGAGTRSLLLPSGLPCSLSVFSPTLCPGRGLRDASQGGEILRASLQSCEPLTRQLATMGQGVWESLLPLLGAGDAGWKAPDTQGCLAHAGRAWLDQSNGGELASL